MKENLCFLGWINLLVEDLEYKSNQEFDESIREHDCE
jgi:hypothetical protein